MKLDGNFICTLSYLTSINLMTQDKKKTLRKIAFYLLLFSFCLFIIIFFLFLSGNTDLLCQNQVNIVAKPNLLWNFRFPRHLHPQFQQQIRILHNLIKKFLSIHHNRKIKPNRQKLGLICPMT